MKKLTGARLLIGGAADAADFRYATGFDAVDPVVFIKFGKTATLIVSAMEKGRALRETRKGIRVIASCELVGMRKKRARLSDWIIAYARQHRIRRFVVTARCPIGIVNRIRRQGISVHVLASPPFPRRECKTPGEIKKIVHAQRAAVAALNAAIAFLRSARISRNGRLVRGNKAISAEDVRQVITIELVRHGCTADGTIVACGSQSADPHERGHGPLRAHQPIVLDIFPRHMRSGYWGDLTRTVVRGRASETVRNMYRAVLAAHHAVLRAARPGVKLARLHDVAKRELEKHGFVTNWRGTPEGFVHGTGHGVGLEIHEAPAIAPIVGALRKGHVVTIEPGLYYRRHGGVRIEDTVWIGADGAHVLARAAYKLEI